MSLHVFVFLLIVCLFLASFAALVPGLVPCSAFQLTRRGQAQQAPPAAAPPRTPLDYPACCYSSPISTGAGPSPLDVASLVRGQKQARSAPSADTLRVLPVPIACARSSGFPMLTFMRLFGDGKHGHTEPLQTFRGSACHTTFCERRSYNHEGAND